MTEGVRRLSALRGLSAPRALGALGRRLGPGDRVERRLRLLRNLTMLLAVVLAGACLSLTTLARGDLQRAATTRKAIIELGTARTDAVNAANDLNLALDQQSVRITGTGPAFTDDVAQVAAALTTAEEDDSGGHAVRTTLEFARTQLAIIQQLAESDLQLRVQSMQGLSAAARERAGESPSAALHALRDGESIVGSASTESSDAGCPDLAATGRSPARGTAICGSGGLIATIADLGTAEAAAEAQERASFWLTGWSVALWVAVPLVLLALAAGALVLRMARWFRMRVVAAPALAVLCGAGAAALAGASTVWWPGISGGWVPLSVTPLLLVGALALIGWACREPLRDYRFEEAR